MVTLIKQRDIFFSPPSLSGLVTLTFTTSQLCDEERARRSTTLHACLQTYVHTHTHARTHPTSLRREAQQVCLIFQTTAATSNSDRKQLGRREKDQKSEKWLISVHFFINPAKTVQMLCEYFDQQPFLRFLFFNHKNMWSNMWINETPSVTSCHIKSICGQSVEKRNKLTVKSAVNLDVLTLWTHSFHPHSTCLFFLYHFSCWCKCSEISQ